MPPKHLELVARASLHGLGYCDVVSDTTISDLHAPTEPACLRRSGHSCVGDASSLPSSADSPQAPHVPDRRSLPAPTPNGFPLQPPRAISPSLEKTPLSLADSSETALPPASLHLNPRSTPTVKRSRFGRIALRPSSCNSTTGKLPPSNCLVSCATRSVMTSRTSCTTETRDCARFAEGSHFFAELLCFFTGRPPSFGIAPLSAL